MTFNLTPIGFIETPFEEKYEAPRQPGLEGIHSKSVIRLTPGNRYEQALKDLDGFSHIWIIYWFDRVSGWKPLILPPRGSAVKRGVFATRSPHRPNPVGLSLVRIEEINGLEIRIGDCDLLNGTPVLDIKPYLSYVESVPEATTGWIGSNLTNGEVLPVWEIEWSITAVKQRLFLERAGLSGFSKKVVQVLSSSPEPHPYKRIKTLENGLFQLAWKDWRLSFRIEGNKVQILEIYSGYQKTAEQPELHRQFRETLFQA